jgi:hypothetical protein
MKLKLSDGEEWHFLLELGVEISIFWCRLVQDFPLESVHVVVVVSCWRKVITQFEVVRQKGETQVARILDDVVNQPNRRKNGN